MKKKLGVTAIIGLQFLIVMGCLFRSTQNYSHFTTPTPLNKEDVLILGILGGRQRWDSPTEGVRRLALKLRGLHLPNAHIETLENRRRELALMLISKAFDHDRSGTLSADEKASAKIVIFGQSFGGAAVVKLARQLHDLQIPVLLTVQVDSIGRHDHVIPSNVRSAANLYQRNGLIIRGEPIIRASDTEKTKILGNFNFDYKDKHISLAGVPWWKKIFRADHSRMNRDPAVWYLVERLILKHLQTDERKHSR